MVDQECQDGRGNNEELDSERVVVPIVSGFELAVNHPDRGERTGDVDHLSKGRMRRVLQLQAQGPSPQ